MPMNAEQPAPFFYVLQDELRILFVDDDPILREFAMVHLSTETATVETSADGEAALVALEAGGADVMLLDLELPGLHGFDVLTRLRESARFADLPVIVVTGREDVAAIDRAYAAGATSFIAKPLNWRMLSYQIRYVCRAAEQERRLKAALAGARAEAEDAKARLGELARQTQRLLERRAAETP
jgi:DNA-binding response OmpR family regulator